jgi:hypothetical protein
MYNATSIRDRIEMRLNMIVNQLNLVQITSLLSCIYLITVTIRILLFKYCFY